MAASTQYLYYIYSGTSLSGGVWDGIFTLHLTTDGAPAMLGSRQGFCACVIGGTISLVL